LLIQELASPKNRLANMFKPFSQVDASTTRKYGGTGLGLAISKKLIELMGGEINAESEPGRGTVFRFTVCFEKEVAVSGMSAEKEGGTSSSAHQLDNYHILLVEDNVFNQKMATIAIEQMGIKVDVASNGREAIEALDRTKYDMVLMDIQMPEVDGIEATRMIRNSQVAARNSRIPIVAMTANATTRDREKCMDAGMDGYISKPIDLKKLEKIITGLLKNRPEK
jgi:CheY-like chemotaxis protein